MSYEQTARAIHKGGCNCGQSVYASFAEALGLTRDEAVQAAPKPRSEGGQCGAFLAGRALLMKLKPEAVSAFAPALDERGLKHSKGAIQFPYGRVDLQLIAKIACWCRDHAGSNKD